MKKSKILAVILLSVILCFVCVTSSTFSWFTRPQTQKAEKFGWDIDYPISQGSGISMKTYSGTRDANGVLTYPAQTVNYSGSLAAGGYKYFRTDITNTGNIPQSVSLYLTSINKTSSSGKFFLGVNGPTRTYKEYFGSIIGATEKTPLNVNKKNFYVGFNTNQTYSPTSYQIHYWGGKNIGDATVKSYFSPNKTGNYADSTYNMTYATIDADSTSAQLWKPSTSSWYDDKNTDINSNNTMIVFLWDGSTKTDDANSGEAAKIGSFYSSATTYLDSTETLSLAATGTAGAGGVTYTSSKPSVATVDSKGVVTRVGVGTTNITVKATGAYGDTISSTCVLEVKAGIPGTNSAEDVPIVTNLKVAPAVDSSNPTVVSVYWYIKNDGSGNLSYTVDDVYLTL